MKEKKNEGKNVDTEKGLGKVVNSNGHAVYPLNGQFAVKREENQLSTAPKGSLTNRFWNARRHGDVRGWVGITL